MREIWHCTLHVKEQHSLNHAKIKRHNLQLLKLNIN